MASIVLNSHPMITFTTATRWSACILSFVLLSGTAASLRAEKVDSLPHIIHQGARHELIVDGAPYLILGGQAHNSSAWPATLPSVWAAINTMDANTLEVPVYWEQLQADPHKFDFSVVDALLKGARDHHVRLVLLWFGTWKNGSAHYLPEWAKAQPELYPKIVGKNGARVDSPSPFAPTMLAGDIGAFKALMHHLKTNDPVHTVIMVQVENEPGAWNSVRDYSPAAEAVFKAPVPKEILSAMSKTAAGGDWTAVFGADADEYFHAWSVAHYIGQVAAAGKAEYALPLYVNAALRDPLSHPTANTYESGGATDNVLDIWKAAAPAIDLLAPDIYMDDTVHYSKVLDLYDRHDNALFIPETGRRSTVSRYCYLALAHGAIGFSPFGIDDSDARQTAEVITPENQTQLQPFAANYHVLRPMTRLIADLAYNGHLHAIIEEKDQGTQTVQMGRWQVNVSFGPAFRGQRDKRTGNPEPVGRVLIGELGDNQFLVTGYLAHVDFKPIDISSGAQREYTHVEEGIFEGENFRPLRIRNGDETDWGLNFNAGPQVLRVKLGIY